MKNLFNFLFGYKYRLAEDFSRVDSAGWKIRNVGYLVIKEYPCRGVREIMYSKDVDDELIGVQFFTKEAAQKYLPLASAVAASKTKSNKNVKRLGYLDGCHLKGFGKIAIS